MKRRDFMRLGLAGAGLSALSAVPQIATAQSASAELLGAGGLFYTKENAGRWSGKVATHLPSAQIEKSANGTIVNVITAHEMNGFEHYIVKHTLLDHNYQFLDEHFFNPTTDKTASSSFNIKSYAGILHVVSMCNKHDLWLATVEV
jgi:superoxide reductase